SALPHGVPRARAGRPPDDPIVNAATLGYPWKLAHGDRILVCSDGVCDLVPDDEVAAMLGQGTVVEAVQALIDLALARGGHDNITCIVGAWEGPSWVEDEQATPVMRVSRDHLPEPRDWEAARAEPRDWEAARAEPRDWEAARAEPRDWE